jgi:hypothetical protein
LPSLLKLDKLLQQQYLSIEEILIVSIETSWEGGMKTFTNPSLRPYEGDQMQDYE